MEHARRERRARRFGGAPASLPLGEDVGAGGQRAQCRSSSSNCERRDPGSLRNGWVLSRSSSSAIAALNSTSEKNVRWRRARVSTARRLERPPPPFPCALGAPRGWHRIEDRDRPARTPPKTLALLAAANRAGPAICTICDHIHRHDGAAGVRRIIGVLSPRQEARSRRGRRGRHRRARARRAHLPLLIDRRTRDPS